MTKNIQRERIEGNEDERGRRERTAQGNSKPICISNVVHTFTYQDVEGHGEDVEAGEEVGQVGLCDHGVGDH